MRLKIVALVTIEIHARDVLEKLYKSGLMDVNSFDWLSQLRFYWEKVLHGATPYSLGPKLTLVI
jgi:dynein heavy chain